MAKALSPVFSRGPRANRPRDRDYDAVLRRGNFASLSNRSGAPLTSEAWSDPVFILCLITVVSGLVLGGGTHAGFLGDAILQLVSLPLALVVAARFLGRRRHPPPLTAMLLWTAIFLVPILQIIPTPPSVWEHFPGHSLRMEAYQAAGRSPGWSTISMIPESTVLAALALVPPAAVFFATLLLNAPQRRALTIAVLGVALISAFVGMAQITGGPQSGLYFFSATNPSEAVGFFANRNHFSAFLYISILLASIWVIDSGLSFANRDMSRKLDLRPLIALVASATLVFLLASSQVMTRSRAGLGLTVVAFIFIAGLIITDPRNKWRAGSLTLLAVAVATVLAFTAQFGFSRFAERLQTGSLVNTRLIIARRSIEAANSYLPLGSGIGTFPSVYSMYERPGEMLIDGYVNHAHDDLLELWLEAGPLGLLVVALVVAWFVRRGFAIYRSAQESDNAVDTLLPRAAFAAAGVLLLHSLVDYPLHTSACMILLSYCAGILVPPAKAAVQGGSIAPEPGDIQIIWSTTDRPQRRKVVLRSVDVPDQCP